jgi:hypothetical protein
MKIIKQKDNIFNVNPIDYALIFGQSNTGSIGDYASWAGFSNDVFLLQQPLTWPHDEERHAKFINTEPINDEELRTIIHDWLKEANDLGKRNLATNGVNNPLQPASNMHPEFEMRQFERARYIETIILSWCKFNKQNFDRINLVSLDSDFLELELNTL